MKKILAALALLCGSVFGQGGLSTGSPVALNSAGRPAGGATVRVCVLTATGTPCSPLANIYQDVALTNPGYAQGSGPQSNPFLTDAQGNYSYYATPGFYKEQVTSGGSTFTRIVQVPTSTGGGGGGGGTGDIESAPTTNQTITQPQGTTLNVNSLNSVRYVTNDFNWSQSGIDDLSSSGAKTITITAPVKGLNGSNTNHYVYISGTGTPEAVKITGGTYSSGSASGTITVTTTQAHTAGWTVSSATSGLKEASEYAKFSPTNPSGSAQAGVLIIPPGAEPKMRAPLYIEASQQTLDGSGSVIECFTTTSCVHLGDDSSSLLYTNIKLKNTRMRAMVPGAAGIVDNSNGAVIDGLKTRNSLSGSYFSFLLQNDNNQAEHVYDLDPSTGSNWGQCTTEPCSVVLKSTGSSSGITYLHNSNLTLGCLGNGIDWKNANTLNIDNTVLQGYSQWGIRSAGGFANTPNINLTNIYTEVGSCTNPNGTGIAGLIAQHGNVNIQGSIGPQGKFPAIVASSPGATSLAYYVVIKSSTLGASVPRLVGPCLTSGTGTCTVKWFPVGASGTITYDLLRVATDFAAGQAAPNGTGNYSVAIALTVGATCSGNTCTVVDTVSTPASSYSVSLPAYFPKIEQWPSSLDLGPNADTSNVNNGSARVTIDDLEGNSAVPGPIAAVGSLYPTITAIHCSTGVNIGPQIIDCRGGFVQNGALATHPELKQLGGTSGTTTADLKGKVIFSLPAAGGSMSHGDFITFDSTPELTAATFGNRAAAQPTDCAIGLDNATPQFMSNSILGIRCSAGISFRIGSIFDGSTWLENLISTAHQTKVPYDFLSGPLYQISGAEVSAPASPAAGFQKGYFKAGAGWCSKDSAGVEYCPGTSTGAVFNSGTPTIDQIAQWVDATHIKGITALTPSLLDFSADNTTQNATSGHHGLLPKLSGNINHCFFGDGSFGTCPGAGSAGITTLGGLTDAIQTLSKVNDTNVTLTITNSSPDHLFTLGWTGTLAKARIIGTAVYNDQANTWSTGAQDFGAATSLKHPTSAGAAPTANGLIAYDSTANVYKGGVNGASKTFAMTDGNIATATSLAANGSNCSGIQFPKGTDASGAAESCAALVDADIPDTITASSYLPLAGGTLTGQLVLPNTGEEFTESDTNPTCASGNFNIYADASEAKLKKCQNGTVTDLDALGGAGSPGGSNTQVQYNSGGTFGGDAGMTYDAATDTLTVGFLQTTGTSADDFTEIAAPTTPAAGHVSVWADSTDHRLHDKNPSGTIGTTVVADTGASNNFLTAISAGGIVSKAQPLFSNLGGTATDAQIPNSITIDLAAAATALAANPSNCGAGQYPKGIDASGVAENCSQINLAADVTGNLPVTSLGSGTSASALTFLRGDMTWVTPAGLGDVVGPSSATDSDLACFDTTSGKLLKDCGLVGTNLVTAGGTLTSGQLVAGAGTKTVAVTNLTGDVTTAGGVATTLANIPTATPMAGSLLATAITAPGTPASGKGSIYVDSTSKNVAVKDDAGTIKHGIQDVSCSNQVMTGVSAAGAGTCTTITSAYVSNTIALTGTDINTSNQVTATHLASPLPVNQGGTGTTSTLTGLVRGSASAMTAAELSGDVTTSGSNAATLANIPTGVPMAGSVLATAITAPGTPAAGKGSVYVDSTSKNIAVKDDAGVVKHGVQDITCTNQAVTAISSAGAGTCTTLTSAYLPASSDTASGIVELATAAETTTGTDATRAVTPDGLAGSTIFGVKTVEVELFPAGTATATGDGKAYFRVPASLNGMNLISAKATVYTAGTTNTTNIDVDRCAAAASGNVCSGTVSDMLSTNMTIDSGENDTATAAAAAVIDTANDDVATGQILRFNVDAISTTPAQGLLVELSFQLP